MSLLGAQIEAVAATMPFRVVGQVLGISGLTIEAGELALPIGALCRIHSFGGKTSKAEVIGFAQDKTLLMPLSPITGVARGDRIENISAAPRIWCSDQLLGRVMNGFGQPIDGKGPLVLSESRRIDHKAVAAMDRTNIRGPWTGCTPAAWGSGWGFFPARASARARSCRAWRSTPARTFR